MLGGPLQDVLDLQTPVLWVPQNSAITLDKEVFLEAIQISPMELAGANSWPIAEKSETADQMPLNSRGSSLLLKFGHLYSLQNPSFGLLDSSQETVPPERHWISHNEPGSSPAIYVHYIQESPALQIHHLGRI